MPHGAKVPTKLEGLLSAPIIWTNWAREPNVLAFLSDLQANILKGHGRDHTANVFVSFDGMKPEEIAGLLTKLSFSVTSALDQLRSTAAFKSVGISGGRVVCIFLAASGYAKLGADNAPFDPAFKQGMRDRGALDPLSFPSIKRTLPGLNDPPPENWEPGGAWSVKNPPPDAMVLIADDNAKLVAAAVAEVKASMRAEGARVLGVDIGLAQRRRQATGGNVKGEGIEHFGYVDGRSQPLFLKEDLDQNKEEQSRKAAELGTNWPEWDEEFAPSQFIVQDPAKRTAFGCGSYFVYRKLEQDVEAFKRRERQLAGWLGLKGEAQERAGALVVGRFEDGTPVVLHDEAIGGDPTNNFNYDNDVDVTKTLCPFKGHIRKTNPRTAGNALERRRIMARRGIIYGNRAPRGEGDDFPEDDRPSGNVGLLFMAYMNDINEQFEFTQAAWAGNPNFQNQNTGIDAVIGQRANASGTDQTKWVDGHSATGAVPPLSASFDFKTAVGLVGGEYFFAPSISFLQMPLPQVGV